ncbi:MAG: UDP-N-acetylmuramate--alanine ligase [Neolewinella sp.]|jgi:D-alanine-D-alanine ligase
MRIKVGIFFGGPSREREISFAGGRTVYDNLDKELFEPVPIFVDSFRKWHLLDWQYLYRGTIRDFFPPIDLAPKSEHGFQVYQESLGPMNELELEAMGRKVGRRIRRDELPELIDLAFLALHGEYGEDGQLQRELEYAGIPYTGSGIEASEIGMDKAIQKELMSAKGFPSPALLVIEKGDFDGKRVQAHFAVCEKEIGWPMVIRPARQGSSIGVAIIEEAEGLESFERAVNAAFFRELLPLNEYTARDAYERLEYVRLLSDLRDGIAFPMDALRGTHKLTLYTPDELHDYLEAAVSQEETIRAKRADNTSNDGTTPLPTTHYPLITFTGHQTESSVIVEGFINGKEFSTIVVRTEDGQVVALPPTEIVKHNSELFDYRSKYMPGRSRKITPIELPTERIQAIRGECERLFTELGFEVYARIDGFHTPSGEIFLNDPNTTSGMMPSSFFFHQAAEIGLNPSQFLTFIIRISLRERGSQWRDEGAMEVADLLGTQLDDAMDAQRAGATTKERIAVILGGTSFERHISVESGRNIYEKLSSSETYRPIPVFLSSGSPLEIPEGSNRFNPRRSEGAQLPVESGVAAPDQAYTLHQLPINLLLKDNADDIHDKLVKTTEHPVVADIRKACAGITARFADPDVVFHPRALPWEELPEIADGVFIALHGRPGEDGQVQANLEPLGLYYNGSGIASSQVTINKHDTLLALREAGLPVTEQWLATADEFIEDEYAFYDKVERIFGYPLIAKPVDDGCSSAVKLIKQRNELHSYCHLTFRPSTLDEVHSRREMKLTAKDEWPINKSNILFEQTITAAGAEKFLEITGGMLTHYGVDGTVRYELFEPSETLAGGEVLSLEEKFLAGEGQNLTPARLATTEYSYDYVAGQVKADLERAARALNVQGYCRIDAFVRVFTDGKVETVPIEINSLPGMTPATAIFHQAAIAGYQPAEFISRILAFGKARRDRGTATPVTEQPTEAATTVAAPIVIKPIIQPTETPVAFSDPPPDPALAPAAPPTKSMAFDPAPEPMNYQEPEQESTPAYTTSAADGPNFKTRALGTLQSLGRMLKSAYFWKNALAAILFFVVCFFVLRTSLGLYTSHGSSTELPDFVTMLQPDAEDLADDLGLTLKFEKGAFDPNRPAGMVVLQHPRAGSGVKKNRSIYLTILSDEAPMIQLPGLVGNYDYTQYTNRLEKSADIRSKVREQVYDPKQEENTILHFFYGDQKITDADLRSGVKVPQGSELEFVVTVRQTGEVSVPNYKCKKFGVVEFLLDGANLLVGKVYGDVSDRSEAYVVRTEPPGGKMVPVGSKFDIYLAERKPDECE